MYNIANAMFVCYSCYVEVIWKEKDKPMKKFLKELVKKIYIPIEKQILYSQNKNIIKDKRVVFLPPPGIGDILLVCEYVDSYSNVYNKIPVIAVTKKMHLQIGELFDKDIEMILLD